MPTANVSELSGVALDWAVAKIELREHTLNDQQIVIWCDTVNWHPSSDWSQGGPIIERECIGIDTAPSLRSGGGPWIAWKDGEDGEDMIGADGPTPFVAAMRCFVASHLGDTVEVPEL